MQRPCSGGRVKRIKAVIRRTRSGVGYIRRIRHGVDIFGFKAAFDNEDDDDVDEVDGKKVLGNGESTA